MNVLLIEPVTELRVMLRGIIKALGVKMLFEPKSSIEGLHIISTEKVNIFICSNETKPFSGMLCTKMMRSAEEVHVRELRSILSVSYVEDGDISKFYNVGVDAVLKKPFSADDVKTLLMKVINNRQPFLETSVYTGPCRRKSTIPYKFLDRRDEFFNPGRGEYKLSLQKIAMRILKKIENEKQSKLSDREQKLKSRGGIIIDREHQEISISVNDLKVGMRTSKPIKTSNNILVIPALTVIDQKAIKRIKDLIHSKSLGDGIWVQKDVLEEVAL